MILLIARASAEDPPVTTPESVHAQGQRLADALAPVTEALLKTIEMTTGIRPARVTVAVEWVDGTDVGPQKPPAPDTKVPSWMS